MSVNSMSDEIEITKTVERFAVDINSGEIEAGADIRLEAVLSCTPAEDLRGQVLLLKDQDGELVTSVEFTEFDDGLNRTNEFSVKAPDEAGEFTWSAVLPSLVPGRFPYEEISIPVSLTVLPHKTRVLVWDVPPAIIRGERFTIKAGVKCSSNCSTVGWVLNVHDHNGVCIATSTIGDQVWPQTASLHYTEFELTPPDVGLHRWKVEAAAKAAALPHEEGSASFGVRVTPQPECKIRVEALDEETQEPIAGAKVVAHPFRTFTDERGFAELRVPKGKFTIFVSGKKFIPFRMEGEIESDLDIKAALAVDRGLTVAEIWS